MPDASIICSHLSFAWPDATRCFPGPVLHLRHRPNRAGGVQRHSARPRCCRLIAGELTPRVALVRRAGGTGRWPTCRRIWPLSGCGSSRSPRCWAWPYGLWPLLAAIEAGDASRGELRHQSATTGHRGTHLRPSWIGSVWASVASTRSRSTLSGGQVTFSRDRGATAEAARRCCCWTNRRTISIWTAREKLYDVVADWKGCAAGGQPRPGVAGPDGSHRRAGCQHDRNYGGNFRRLRRPRSRPSRRRPSAASAMPNSQLKRERREMQQARERASRRASGGARDRPQRQHPQDGGGHLETAAPRSRQAAPAHDAPCGQRVTVRPGPAGRGRAARCAMTSTIVIELPGHPGAGGAHGFLRQRHHLGSERAHQNLYRGAGLDAG